MEGLHASTADRGSVVQHLRTISLGSRGAAKLFRLPPAQRISVALMVQRALCLTWIC